MSKVRVAVYGFFGGIVVVIGGAWLYLFVLGGLESQVNHRLERLLGEDSPVQVEVDKIDGDLVSDLVLVDVVMNAEINGKTIPVITVDTIKAVYQLSDLIRSDFAFSELEIINPSIMLVKSDSGKWALPGLAERRKLAQGKLSAGDSSKVADTTKAEFPPLNIDALIIEGLKLTLIDGNDTIHAEKGSLLAAVWANNQVQSVDIRQFSLSSTDRLFAIQNASAKLTIQNGNMYVQDGFLMHESTRVRYDGQLHLATMNGWFDLNIDNLDMAEVSRITGASLTGNVDLSGRLELIEGHLKGKVSLGGKFINIDLENLSLILDYVSGELKLQSIYGSVMGGCTIDGSGYINFNETPEQYWMDARVNNFDLSHIVAGSFPSDINGDLYVEGESFSNATLALNFDLSLDESSFDDYNFHAGQGHLFVTVDSLVFSDSFQISYFENDFQLSGRVAYSDSVNLMLNGELNDLARYQGKLFLDQPGGRGTLKATLTGLTASPDLLGEFHSDSLWLYGLYADSAKGSYRVNQMFSGQRGKVEASFYSGSAWDIPYDSLYMLLTPDSNVLYIDSAEVNTRVASIWTSGLLGHSVYPQEVSLDTLGIVFFDQRFTNSGKVNFDIDSSGFDFHRATIARTNARLFVDGRVGYDENMSLKVEADNVRVAPWIALFENTPQLNALLSAKIDLRGSFEDPVFEFAGNLDELTDLDTTATGSTLLLGDLVARASYDDGVLTIDTVQLFTPGGQHSAAGYLHTDLALVGDDRDRFPDLPFDIHVTSNEERFDLIMKRLPAVDSLSGEFAADVRLTGTPSDPLLEGQALLVNGRLLYSDLVDPIFTDSAYATMTNDRIELNKLPVYVLTRNGKKANGTVDGVITVKSFDNLHYNVDIDLPNEFPVRYALEDIEGVVSGKVHVEGDTPPKVTGDFLLTSLDYQVPFADEDEGSPIMQAFAGDQTWDLDIDVDVPSRFRVKNPDIDAEFSGNLTLLRENGVTRFMGELDVIRGRAFLFDKTFRLDAGSNVSFQGDPNINPNLDITANTKILGIPQQTETGSTREQTELAVHITGTLEAPEINPVEGSGISKEEIVPLLVANYYSTDTLQTSSALEARLTSLVSSQVTQRTSVSIGNSTLAIEEIDPTYSGQLDWSRASVTTGVYYSSLYAYGVSTPGQGNYLQEFGAEYRFSRSLLLEGQRTDKEEYRLNLKLHLEF